MRQFGTFQGVFLRGHLRCRSFASVRGFSRLAAHPYWGTCVVRVFDPHGRASCAELIVVSHGSRPRFVVRKVRSRRSHRSTISNRRSASRVGFGRLRAEPIRIDSLQRRRGHTFGGTFGKRGTVDHTIRCGTGLSLRRRRRCQASIAAGRHDPWIKSVPATSALLFRRRRNAVSACLKASVSCCRRRSRDRENEYG